MVEKWNIHLNFYTFGPTFRAENSNTSRHLAEFWMVEPEMAFCEIEGNMNLAEEFLKYTIRYVLEHCREDLEFFNQFIEKSVLATLEHVAESDFGHITYTDAVTELQKSGKTWEFPVEWGCDLQTEHERFLSEEIFKKPLIVTDYPKAIKAFYMRVNDDDKTVRAMDVLVPRVGEIIGGRAKSDMIRELPIRHTGQIFLLAKFSGLYYGWRMVGAASALRVLGAGLHSFGFTVFFLPLSQDLNIIARRLRWRFPWPALKARSKAPSSVICSTASVPSRS